jgi:sugar lactone lactonase YvrE
VAALGVALAPAAGAATLPTSGFTIWTVAGSGGMCSTPTGPCGDGGLAIDAPIIPAGIAFDSQRNLYVSDYAAHKIRRVAPNGRISTIAGDGTACSGTGAACGDGPNASVARLNSPASLLVDPHDNLYVAEENGYRIRRISPSGAITTVVGTGTACASGANPCGDGGPGGAAQIGVPGGMEYNAATGDLYFADGGDNRIRRLDSSGVVHAFAGTGGACPSAANACGDGGPALAAQFNFPLDIRARPSGGYYISDLGDQRVRLLEPGGNMSTIAGTGAQCADPTTPCGDGGAATSATFRGPQGLAVDARGGLLVSDRLDFRIRRIQNGGIDTVAGTGETCSLLSRCGDGGSATEARFGFAPWLAEDPDGNGFYATDGTVGAVRWLAGPQSGPPGNGATGPPGPPGPAGPQAAPSNVRTKCTARRRKSRARPAMRCQVTYSPKSNGMVTVRVVRRKRVFATGRGNARRGKATIKMKVRRAVPRGRYTTSTGVALSGLPVSSTQPVRIR